MRPRIPQMAYLVVRNEEYLAINGNITRDHTKA
jgi:hypothetical protein